MDLTQMAPDLPHLYKEAEGEGAQDNQTSALWECFLQQYLSNSDVAYRIFSQSPPEETCNDGDDQLRKIDTDIVAFKRGAKDSAGNPEPFVMIHGEFQSRGNPDIEEVESRLFMACEASAQPQIYGLTALGGSAKFWSWDRKTRRFIGLSEDEGDEVTQGYSDMKDPYASSKILQAMELILADPPFKYERAALLSRPNPSASFNDGMEEDWQ